MSQIPGQVTFEGREVSGNKIVIPGGLGELDFVPPSGVSPMLRNGDRLTFEVTYVVKDVHGPEKFDNDGNATENIKRMAELKPLLAGLKLLKVVSRDAMDAAWAAAHDTAQQA